MTGAAAIAVTPQIEAAIKSASVRTGTGFDYLLNTAIRESGLKVQAKSNSSSATGLFQFVEQTWLKTVQTTGARHGLAAQAAAISRDAQGRYDVADPQVRQEILALRKDPRISAAMAGELTRANELVLRAALGRAPSGGELYIGHFLGARGASQLIRATSVDGQALATTQFPAAARANPAIFNRADGTSRTVAEVYNNLVAKHASTAVVATKGPGTAGPRAAGPMSILPDRMAIALAGLAPQASRQIEAARAPVSNFLDLYGTARERGQPAQRSAATRLVALRLYSGPSSAPPAPPASPARNQALWGGGLFTSLPVTRAN